MKSYYYDESDPSSYQHDHDSGIEVTPEQLKQIGVLYYHLDNMDDVNKLAKQREYKNRDQISLSSNSFPGGQEALKAKLDTFIEEHLHEDEEIRYIVEGSGFFDVRDSNDKWIRNKCEKNDLLILPAGIYHRFTLDCDNNVVALRLFKDEPKWIALNRPVSADNQYREEYLQSIKA
ncbi:acireductone dioxygenase (Ni2+-requiring) [Saccharomycopsis crataegensis]|uniref:Acireductone dioxygenase n=1 Tax=Saccharomycopsis crataegensis TaxID=43959 RepID=A0AAV5QT01_9ASCO|nr:acireductone dioxygenase (Ni2+-requiring) [Saccharomycopsis crataegensis]